MGWTTFSYTCSANHQVQKNSHSIKGTFEQMIKWKNNLFALIGSWNLARNQRCNYDILTIVAQVDDYKYFKYIAFQCDDSCFLPIHYMTNFIFWIQYSKCIPKMQHWDAWYDGNNLLKRNGAWRVIGCL